MQKKEQMCTGHGATVPFRCIKIEKRYSQTIEKLLVWKCPLFRCAGKW